MDNSLWPLGQRIEILGVTGKHSSGKSLFAATIDPGRTLYYDLEKSAATYEGLGFHRVDWPAELRKKFPGGCTPRQNYEYWSQHVRQTEPGKYSVLVIDPIHDIDDGLAESVASQYGKFGFKSKESLVATQGIFWSKVKAELEDVLLDIASRVECLAFTCHTRAVYRGGKITKESTHAGKTSLSKLATLFLWLEREPDAKGNIPMVPSARVEKSRLANTEVIDGKVVIRAVLPPRLPEATPDAIRQYLLQPADWDNLKDEEKLPESRLTEDERLVLAAEAAADRRAAEETAMETARMAAGAREAAIAKMQASKERPASISTTEGPGTEAVSTDDPGWILEAARKQGVEDRVKAGIAKRLAARGIESDGSDPALLTPEELGQFRASLLKLAAS